MIDSLIKKYITQFNERQYKLNLIDYHLKKEPYKQSLLDERHDIERDISKYNEFIKDLEELKPEIDKKSLLSYLDYGCGSYFELGSQHEEFLENIKEYLGVDIDE